MTAIKQKNVEKMSSVFSGIVKISLLLTIKTISPLPKPIYLLIYN